VAPKIAFRYFAVELLTRATLSRRLAIVPVAIAIALLGLRVRLLSRRPLSTSNTLSFRPDHDRRRYGGMIASVLVPELMNTDSRSAALVHSALGCGVGYIVLWIVPEAGRSRSEKKIRLDGPTR